MPLFRSKVRNHIFGRMWEPGETLDHPVIPSHHWEPVGVAQPAPQAPAADIMRPIPKKGETGPATLSEAAETPKPLGGFAGGMNAEADNPFKRPRTRVRNKK